MRISAPLLLLVCALVTALISLIGDDSYAKLGALQRGVETQERTNAHLEEQVHMLRRDVTALQNDPRAIEKAARSELGMARPNELIVVFEKDQRKSDGSRR